MNIRLPENVALLVLTPAVLALATRAHNDITALTQRIERVQCDLGSLGDELNERIRTAEISDLLADSCLQELETRFNLSSASVVYLGCGLSESELATVRELSAEYQAVKRGTERRRTGIEQQQVRVAKASEILAECKQGLRAAHSILAQLDVPADWRPRVPYYVVVD